MAASPGVHRGRRINIMDYLFLDSDFVSAKMMSDE
jgi:hypothetical protein